MEIGAGEIVLGLEKGGDAAFLRSAGNAAKLIRINQWLVEVAEALRLVPCRLKILREHAATLLP